MLMQPIILKPQLNRSARLNGRLIVLVDAVVACVLLAAAWFSAGWLGYVLLDRHSSGTARLTALGVTLAYQIAAFAMAARARRARN
jgi:hypothetical protein